MSRVYYYAETNATNQTSTSTFAAVQVDLKFLPRPNRNHIVLWSSRYGGDGGFEQYSVRIQNITDGTTISQPTFSTVQPGVERYSMEGIGFYTSTGSPTTVTLQMQYASPGAGVTMSIGDATIMVLELEGRDKWVENINTQTINSATTLTAVSPLTFNVISLADYLFIASAELRTTNGASGPGIKTILNGSDASVMAPYDYGGESGQGGFYPFAHFTRGVAVSGSQSYAVQWWNQFGTNNLEMRRVRLAALHMGNFPSYTWAQDDTAHSTSSAAYTDSTAKIDSVTAIAKDYALWACGLHSTNDAQAAEPFAEAATIIKRNGTTLNTNPVITATFAGNEQPWAMFRVIAESAASVSYAPAYALAVSGTSANPLGVFDDFVIAHVLLQDTVTTTTSNIPPDTVAASSNFGAFAVTDIDEGVDNNDGTWATASTSATVDLRVTFGSPPAAPVNLQNFRVLARLGAAPFGTSAARLDGYLWQNGVSIVALGSVTISTTQIVKFDWTASQLSGTVDGTDVEFRLVGNPGGGIGALPAYSDSGVINASATAPGLHTLTCVTAVNSGDLLIAQLQIRNGNNNGTAVANTAGWNAFAGNPYAQSNCRLALFYKVSDGTEASSLNVFSVSSGITSDLFHGRIHRFTAANGFAATPITAITLTGSTNTPLSAPTVTPTGSNQLAVVMGAVADGIVGLPSFAGESGGDWTLANANVSSLGGNGTIFVQTSNQSSAAQITGGSLSFSASAAGQNWVAVGFVLVPSTVAVSVLDIGAIEWDANFGTTSGVGAVTLNATSLIAIATYGRQIIVIPHGIP